MVHTTNPAGYARYRTENHGKVLVRSNAATLHTGNSHEVTFMERLRKLKALGVKQALVAGQWVEISLYI